MTTKQLIASELAQAMFNALARQRHHERIHGCKRKKPPCEERGRLMKILGDAASNYYDYASEHQLADGV